MSKRRGKLIVVDGGEGAGKSTMIQYAKEIFDESELLFTREPGGSVLGEKIREVMLSEEAAQASGETQFGLIWAARHDHLHKLILPKLKQGVNVLSDRFDSSTYLMQIYGQECGHMKDIFWSTRDIFLKEQKPDLYIFLDVDPEVSLQRVAGRAGDQNHFDRRPIDFYQRARTGYLEFADRVPSVVIDANRDIESVRKDFIDILSSSLYEN